MEKYILIVHGNGEGYSDPAIEIFNSKNSAIIIAETICKHWIPFDSNNLKEEKYFELKTWVYEYSNDENDYVVKIIKVDYFKNYLISMDCSYSNEIAIKEFNKKNLDDEVKHYNFLQEELNEYEFNKNYTTFGGHIDEDSTYIHLQIV